MVTEVVPKEKYEDIRDRFHRLCKENADLQAFIELDNNGKENKQVTYKKLYSQACNVARNLLAKGLKTDDKVLLVFIPGATDVITALYGCIICGVIPVCVFPPDPRKLSADLPKFFKTINDCSAKFILTNKDYFRAFFAAKFFSSVKWPQVTWLKVNELKKEGKAPAVKLEDLPRSSFLFLQYTSGSTSDPKGCMQSHHAVLENVFINGHSLLGDKRVNVVNWLPHFHDFGIIANIFVPIYFGHLLILMSPMTFLQNPPLWLKMCSKYKSAVSTIPNFALGLALRKVTAKDKASMDLSNLRFYISSEPVRTATCLKFAQEFASCGVTLDNLRPAYGMAEHVLTITFASTFKYAAIDKNAFANNKIVLVDEKTTPAENVKQVTSSGPTMKNAQVLIVNPDTKEEVKELEIGEIWVSSYMKSEGYLNKPEASHETFENTLANGDKGMSGTGFLRTGDTGFFHQGELYVTGRIKDLIIVAGRNYYPSDIEIIIEDVDQKNIRQGCSVIFELEMDEQEVMVALVELRETGKADYYEKLADQINTAVLLNYQVPLHAVCLMEAKAIPKTSSGKVSRQPAKQKYLDNSFKFLYKKQFEIKPPENYSEEVSLEEVSEGVAKAAI